MPEIAWTDVECFIKKQSEDLQFHSERSEEFCELLKESMTWLFGTPLYEQINDKIKEYEQGLQERARSNKRKS